MGCDWLLFKLLRSIFTFGVEKFLDTGHCVMTILAVSYCFSSQNKISATSSAIFLGKMAFWNFQAQVDKNSIVMRCQKWQKNS